eukprot:gene2811-biopygen1366
MPIPREAELRFQRTLLVRLRNRTRRGDSLALPGNTRSHHRTLKVEMHNLRKTKISDLHSPTPYLATVHPVPGR